MSFADDVERVANSPAMRRVAFGRARSRELAEDALQETYYTVARVQHPENIRDLEAFFRTSLIREISHQRARAPVPVEDIAAEADQRREASSLGSPPDSVEHEAALRLLAQRVTGRLDRDRDQLMGAVPGRSLDPRRYRGAIVDAARAIVLLLLEGSVASADWNDILKAQYPQWCNQGGLAHASIDQRLSRARADVRQILRMIVPRHELG